MIPVSTRLRYANGYLELGMAREATAELDAIDAAESERTDVLTLRVLLYLQTRDWKRMAAAAQRLADSEPQNPIGWVHWAYALREQDKVGQARDVATSGVEQHPEEAVLWFNLACYSSLLGDVGASARQLARAIKLNEDFAEDAASDPDLANLRQSQAS